MLTRQAQDRGEAKRSSSDPCSEERKVPATMHEQLKTELSRIESLGVIEKNDKPTNWVNSLVVVERKKMGPEGSVLIPKIESGNSKIPLSATHRRKKFYKVTWCTIFQYFRC